MKISCFSLSCNKMDCRQNGMLRNKTVSFPIYSRKKNVLKTLKILLGIVVASLSCSALSQEIEQQDTKRLDHRSEIIRQNATSERLERERELEKIREKAEHEAERIRHKTHEIGDPCKINSSLPVCLERVDK